MNGLALLGLLLVLYGLLVVYLAARKPKSIWEMGKIRAFRKVLGETGTVIFFYVFAAASVGVGIWLLVR